MHKPSSCYCFRGIWRLFIMHQHLSLNELQCMEVRAERWVGRRLKGKSIFFLRRSRWNASVSLHRRWSPFLDRSVSQVDPLQSCCLSLATFSLRKCCIRQAANRPSHCLSTSGSSTGLSLGVNSYNALLLSLTAMTFSFPPTLLRETGWTSCFCWLQSGWYHFHYRQGGKQSRDKKEAR